MFGEASVSPSGPGSAVEKLHVIVTNFVPKAFADVALVASDGTLESATRLRQALRALLTEDPAGPSPAQLEVGLDEVWTVREEFLESTRRDLGTS